MKKILDVFQVLASILSLATFFCLYWLYFEHSSFNRQIYHRAILHPHRSYEMLVLNLFLAAHVLLLLNSIATLILVDKFSSVYHRLLHIQECLSSLLFIVFYVLFLHNVVTLYLVHSIVLCRLFRFISLILKIRVLRLITNAVINILPQFLDHLVILFSLYLFFGAVGIQLFGGLLSKELSYAEHHLPPSYAANNFNDLPSAFVTCFELMIVNNWHVIAKMHSVFYGDENVLIFFILFYHFSVLFGIQIIVAIIIEWMTQTLSYVKS